MNLSLLRPVLDLSQGLIYSSSLIFANLELQANKEDNHMNANSVRND